MHYGVDSQDALLYMPARGLLVAVLSRTDSEAFQSGQHPLGLGYSKYPPASACFSTA